MRCVCPDSLGNLKYNEDYNHYDDEQPTIREELDKHDLSYFKHGGVSFGGNDEFSTGLAYGVSACSQSVRKKS